MKLTSAERKVLNIFKEHHIEEGEYLAIQTLRRERLTLSKAIQKNWDDIIKILIREGYISYDPLGYGLTEKGHFVICQDK